jgi:type I restriction enzyme S subunit
MEIKRCKLKELALNITDGEHGSVIDDPNGKHFLLSNKNIIAGRIIYDTDDRIISENSFMKIKSRTKLEYEDVVLSTVGTIGKAAIIKDKIINYDFQRSVGIIKCNPSLLTPQYLYYYLNLATVQKRLKVLSTGAVQKCLFISDLEELDIDVPAEFNEQLKIANILKLMEDKIEVNTSINQELQSMASNIFNYTFFNSNSLFTTKNDLSNLSMAAEPKEKYGKQ